MGMAASQARYLALVARKSNCEYEGQQINQARTALSNQSANLFNQMLGLTVPVPPSTQDFTKTQYSFTDGVNSVTIDSWNQLATPEEDYNYVVNYYYTANVYTGGQKQLNDPQVQFSGALPTADTSVYAAQIKAIEDAQVEIQKAQADYDEKLAEYQTKLTEASKLPTYADNNIHSNVLNHSVDENGNYTIITQAKNDAGYLIYDLNDTGNTQLYYKDGKYYDLRTDQEYTDSLTGMTPHASDTNVTYTPYTKLTDQTKLNVADAFEQLKKYGALSADFSEDNVYYDTASGTIAFKSDLDELVMTGGSGTKTILPSYHINDTGKAEDDTWKSINGMNQEVVALKGQVDAAKARLDLANAAFDALSVPSYIGNNQLTSLSELSTDQMAEIAQIIKDMQTQNVNTNLTKCFNTLDGTYSPENYSGGIYSFKMNGTTYYTTYYDLAATANSGEGINHIDNQQKLPYYNASYVSTKIEKTDKALLETDSQGRFTSIRLGDDTVTYTLKMETVTDNVAYEDAMNQYYYENAKYDKMVQDINAKTSIIQHEDQQLELRLKQLDTEQNALSTEIDAVSKVVKDNVEKSFKTFGG